jgi:hypothetical protein
MSTEILQMFITLSRGQMNTKDKQVAFRATQCCKTPNILNSNMLKKAKLYLVELSVFHNAESVFLLL